MKYFICFAIVFFSLPAIAEDLCWDIHLKSGNIIKRVQYRLENVSGTEIVVFWQADRPSEVQKFPVSLVEHFIKVSCESYSDSRFISPTNPPLTSNYSSYADASGINNSEGLGELSDFGEVLVGLGLLFGAIAIITPVIGLWVILYYCIIFPIRVESIHAYLKRMSKNYL